MDDNLDERSKADPIEHHMFIVKDSGVFYGPFLRNEADAFASTREGELEVIPLIVLPVADEVRTPAQRQPQKAVTYRAHVDSFKVDTRHLLASIIWEFYFARRDERVLTVSQIMQIWNGLSRIGGAVESLMHHVDKVIDEPSPQNLEAMRKAIWRNRDSDDVDPHYRDRFW